MAKEYQITDPNDVDYLKINNKKSSILDLSNHNSLLK